MTSRLVTPQGGRLILKLELAWWRGIDCTLML